MTALKQIEEIYLKYNIKLLSDIYAVTSFEFNIEVGIIFKFSNLTSSPQVPGLIAGPENWCVQYGTMHDYNNTIIRPFSSYIIYTDIDLVRSKERIKYPLLPVCWTLIGIKGQEEWAYNYNIQFMTIKI